MAGSLPSSSIVLAGTLAKASFDGAKTVNGPVPFRVSVKPDLTTSELRVLSLGLAAMVSATDTGAERVAQPPSAAIVKAVRAVHRIRWWWSILGNLLNVWVETPESVESPGDSSVTIF